MYIIVVVHKIKINVELCYEFEIKLRNKRNVRKKHKIYAYFVRPLRSQGLAGDIDQWPVRYTLGNRGALVECTRPAVGNSVPKRVRVI